MTIFEHIGSANLVVTPFILVLLLAIRRMDKKFAPSGRRALWGMVMVGLLWPFVASLTPHRPVLPVVLSMPVMETVETINTSELLTSQASNIVQSQAREDSSQSNLASSTAAGMSIWALEPAVLDAGESIFATGRVGSESTMPQTLYVMAERPDRPAANYRQHVAQPMPEAIEYAATPISNHLLVAAMAVIALAHGVLTAISLPMLLLAIYILGALAFAAYQWKHHYSLTRHLHRWQLPVCENTAAVFAVEKERLGIRRRIRLAYAVNSHATLLTGFFCPTIYLADMKYSTEELSLIFRHELMHHKRGDLWYKLALLVVRCIYWYNPAVHLMARQAGKDLEAICDHATVYGMDIGLRKSYGTLLLRMAADARTLSPLTTQISGGKNMLKQRLTNILQGNRPGNKKYLLTAGIGLLAMAFFVGIQFGYDAEAYAAEPAIEDVQYVHTDSEPVLSAFTTSNEPVTTVWHTDPRIRSFWEERAYKRNAAGLLPYSDSHAELHALIFDEPRIVELRFDNVSAITVNANDDVRITQYGDNFIIRYAEWVEGNYLVSTNGQHLRLDYGVPFFNGPMCASYSSGFLGSSSVVGDHIVYDGWLQRYLQNRGDEPRTTIEIIVPMNRMIPTINVNSKTGDVYIQDAQVGSVTVNASVGGVYIDNSFVRSGTFNLSMGGFEKRNTSFISLTANMSMGSARLYLANNVAAYNIQASVAMGNLRLGGEYVHPYYLRRCGPQTLRVSASMGDIDIICLEGSVGAGDDSHNLFQQNIVFTNTGTEAVLGTAVLEINSSLTNVAVALPNVSTRTSLIGIVGMDISSAYRDLFGLPSIGVMVTDIVPGGGAEAAGLEQRDIIVDFDGNWIHNQVDLSSARASTVVGQEVVISLYRGSERIEVVIVVS